MYSSQQSLTLELYSLIEALIISQAYQRNLYFCLFNIYIVRLHQIKSHSNAQGNSWVGLKFTLKLVYEKINTSLVLNRNSWQSKARSISICSNAFAILGASIDINFLSKIFNLNSRNLQVCVIISSRIIFLNMLHSVELILPYLGIQHQFNTVIIT